MKTVGWTDNPRWDAAAFAAVHLHTDGIPGRINTLCSRVLQFGALDEHTVITGDMVDEVADEMAEGLNGVDAAAPVNGERKNAASDTRGHTVEHAVKERPNGHSVIAIRSDTPGDMADLLHRIEAWRK